MLVILLLFLPPAYSFIVGGCIGPKSVLERHLTEDQRHELRRLVHTEFDGENVQQVLTSVNGFVHDRISTEQWQSILPELKAYQSREHECSIYAQLLSKETYKMLLQSVWRAFEMGASKHDIKRLVEDYVDRLSKSEGFDLEEMTTTTVIPIIPKNTFRTKHVRLPPRVNAGYYKWNPRIDYQSSNRERNHLQNGVYSNSFRSKVGGPKRVLSTLPPIFPMVQFRHFGRPMDNRLHG